MDFHGKISGSPSPTSQLDQYPMRIPVHHLYQSVTVPVQHHTYSSSFPSSPSISQHRPRFPTGTSLSWPVFPNDAQLSTKRSSSVAARPVREAVLHTKTSVAKGTMSPTIPPKMHLFAGGKNAKCAQSSLKEEDFPLPPVEWMIGGGGMSSTESSVSSSETQSGETSEDESEESFSSRRSPVSSSMSEPRSPSVMISCGAKDGFVNGCHVLSENLKVLLKINA